MGPPRVSDLSLPKKKHIVWVCSELSFSQEKSVPSVRQPKLVLYPRIFAGVLPLFVILILYRMTEIFSASSSLANSPSIYALSLLIRASALSLAASAALRACTPKPRRCVVCRFMLRPCRSIAFRVLYAAQMPRTPTMTKIAPNTQVVRSIQSLVTDTGGSSATLMGCCAFGLFALSRRCSFGEESRALAGDDDLAALGSSFGH